MIRLTLSMAVLAFASGTALAAEDALQRAERCASVADSLERLVCYDRVFAPGRAAAGTATRTAPMPAPTVPATPPVATATVPATPPAAPAAATGASAAPAAAAAPSADSASFGADQLRRAPSEEQDEPRTLTAKVQELRETRPNVYRIGLDNGQIWQQMDMDSLFHVEVGDTVEINRGRLGGYRMARQNRGGSGWVRVNRVR